MWRAQVRQVEWLSAEMVRIVLGSDQLAEFPHLPYADHYVKLFFPAPGAPYGLPVDADRIRESLPRELWPVTRTYTIRWFDRARRELALDFVVHGDNGLAGPWAATAAVGDEITFRGPGGAWAPPAVADAVVFVGDESALPAIAVGLEQLDPSITGIVVAEVTGESSRIELPAHPRTHVRWVHRDAGENLADVVLGTALPTGLVFAFVHGNANMIRPVRRHLLATLGWPRARTSISGYWRSGQTEDLWQATKHEFAAALELDA